MILFVLIGRFNKFRQVSTNLDKYSQVKTNFRFVIFWFWPVHCAICPGRYGDFRQVSTSFNKFRQVKTNFHCVIFWFWPVWYVPIEQVLCAIGPGRCGQYAAPAVFCSSGLLLLVKAIPVMEFQVQGLLFFNEKNEKVLRWFLT